MRRYSEYKESGVEWIGKIPKHWETKAVWMMFHLGRGRVISNEEIVANPGQYPVYSSQTENEGIMGYIDTYDFDGDYITWTTDGAKAGTVFYRTGQFNCTNVCGTLLPKNQGLDLRFFRHALNITTSRFVRYDINPKLMNNVMAKIRVQVPSETEQTQIANFLDRKTEQIDELIRIKERQIALLQEQRTALINQVVTKGLDPNVEMKPSGVEWIGEIPAHWEVNRLKHVAKILPSNVDKHIYPDEIQVRLCNYTDVYYNDYITVDTVLKKGSCKESEFAKFALRKGDVIITKDSETPDDIGVPTYVKDDLDNVVCGYHLTMIRPFACLGEFVFRFIQSDRTRRYFEVNSNGITRYGLGKSSIENLLLPIPTDSEQRQIADFLNNKTKQIDELISAEQRKIELLKEYRQSLISEAVTGKIDVRNEV